MNVEVSGTRAALGQKAARDIAAAIRKGLHGKDHLRMVLAAAPSQSEMLTALRHEPEIDWSRISAFHMDEYIGLPTDSPQRFANWLRAQFVDHLPLARFEAIDTEGDPEVACGSYAGLLAEAPIDLVLLGIGTNGHLAFNDPPADLQDPVAVKMVRLDQMCREQQVLDGCFVSLNDVPKHAVTLTIPTLLAGGQMFCCVPDTVRIRPCRQRCTRPSAANVRRRHCALILSAPCISTVNRARGTSSNGNDLHHRTRPTDRRCIRLGVSAGVIKDVNESSEATDLYISAGLVDLQVNGCGGFDVNADNVTSATIEALTDVMLRHGVTCFAPTIITAPEQAICNALRVIAGTRRKSSKVAKCIPFVHVEGPHISALDGYRGAHRLDAVRPPSVAEYERWQQASDGCVGMVTLSPHFAESSAYIEALALQGVLVAIGHSHATAEEVHRAADAGARLSTHLGNGIAATIRRHDNSLWPQLADDRLAASLIADGHHLPADVLKVVLRAKGLEKVILVSDQVALACLPPGSYSTPVGGDVELRADGRVCLPGTDMLAGATASLAECVGRLVQMTGTSLGEALLLATRNPGRLVGGRGELVPGARADVLRFRWQDAIEIKDVWLAGVCVYSSTDTTSAHGVKR